MSTLRLRGSVSYPGVGVRESECNDLALYREGYRRLCVGVMLQALADLRNRRTAPETLSWLQGGTKYKPLVSFADCCSALGLSPHNTRTAILAKYRDYKNGDKGALCGLTQYATSNIG